jgi:hypothetical protein
MYQPSMELYCKHHCPACNTVNWTYHGNSQSDGTDGDADACQCWSCGVAYWLLEEDLADDIYDGDLDDAETQKGRETP